MARQTILIMRHADKPEPDGDGGVDAVGVPDKKSLTPRGWQGGADPRREGVAVGW